MAETLVTVCAVAGRLEADRIQSWLEAEGIPAMVSQQSAQSAFSLTVGPFGCAEVLVPASRAEEAKALLATMPPGELDQDCGSSDPTPPPGG